MKNFDPTAEMVGMALTTAQKVEMIKATTAMSTGIFAVGSMQVGSFNKRECIVMLIRITTCEAWLV